MKLVVSHLTGNANVKAALQGFAEAGLLEQYYVSMATFPGGILDRLSALGPFAELKRRQYDGLLEPFTKMWPWMEMGRMFAMKGGLMNLTLKPGALFYVDAVVRNLDRHVAAQLTSAKQHGVTAVYGYEDTIRLAFREAKRLHLKCLYDLPIGYWRAAHRLMADEQERWPEWIDTMTGLHDSQEKLDRKEEELALADHIFVASNFTASTLTDYPGKLAPVHVIPYGFPPVMADRTYEVTQGPLKLLFVGGLSQRKGIANLITAVGNIGHGIELTIVGGKKTEDCVPLNIALAKHRWIPSLSHEGVLKLMRAHDVLVFPSLFEGFGLVITEAMSQGTPVITTDRTVGPNFINDGVNGWLVEAGSTEALQQSIEKILEQRDMVVDVGRAAMETARKRTWADYSFELAKAVALTDHK